MKWLSPVAGALFLGVVLGILVRANDVLNFQPRDLRANLRAQGFDEKQVEQIMTKIAGEVTYEAARKTPDRSGSFVQSLPTETQE